MNPQQKKGKTMGRIKVNVRVLYDSIRCARLCESKDDTRENICGVLFEIEKNEVRLISTNGHVLLALMISQLEPFEQDFSFFLPDSKKLEAFTKDRRDNTIEDLTIEVSEKNIVVSQGPHEKILIDRTEKNRSSFPNWRTEIPDHDKIKKSIRVGINPKYLELPAKIQKYLGRYSGIAISTGRELDPILFSANKAESGKKWPSLVESRYLLVVMPMQL